MFTFTGIPKCLAEDSFPPRTPRLAGSQTANFVLELNARQAVHRQDFDSATASLIRLPRTLSEMSLKWVSLAVHGHGYVRGRQYEIAD
jgi:hypothetical protein